MLALVYLFKPAHSCLSMFTYYVYPYLLVFPCFFVLAYVYLFLLLFTYVLPLFTRACLTMFTHIYSILPMFTLGY